MSIERDDLRKLGETHGSSQQRVPLPVTDEDLAALGYVKVTVDCEDCDGGIVTTASGGRYYCHTCGGSGKKLRDGAKQLTPGKSYWISIPAEWLEAFYG